jgi:hypothetical protein
VIGKILGFPISVGIIIGLLFFFFGPDGWIRKTIIADDKMVEQVFIEAYQQKFVFKDKKLRSEYEATIKNLINNGELK